MNAAQREMWWGRLYEAGLKGAAWAGVSSQDVPDCALKFTYRLLEKGEDRVKTKLAEPYADAWLTRCAVNFARNYRKQVLTEQRKCSLVGREGEDGDSPACTGRDSAPSPEVLTLRACFLADARAVPGLTQEQQDLLNRRFLLGQDRKTISAALGISLAAVDMRLARLEKRLPGLLERMGWCFEDLI